MTETRGKQERILPKKTFGLLPEIEGRQHKEKRVTKFGKCPPGRRKCIMKK